MELPHILLVEDNPDDEDLTKRALAKSHIANDVVVVHDGAEALDYIFGRGVYSDRDASDLPAVVLLDLRLPKVDGLEVLQRIRADEQKKQLPIVILTSSQEEQDRLSGYLSGANSYMEKPVDIDKFIEVAEQLHLHWQVLNERPASAAKQEVSLGANLEGF